MTSLTLDGHLGRVVTIDRCDGCQVWWFDAGENLQLSPRGTLTMFRHIGEQAGRPRRSLSPVLKCPRCESPLRLTHDRQRNVAFRYERCTHGHGRLITDIDFLREKHIVRPLGAAQLEQLRAQVHTVNCSNCGGPVDLAEHSTCGHCGSPLSILDLQQAGDVIAQLQKADRPPTEPDPLLPLRLAAARRDVERSFADLSTTPGSGTGVDLLSAGLAALSEWLKK